MKKLIIAIVLLFSVVACKEINKEEQKEIADIQYVSFGKKITSESPISKEEMFKKFDKLKKGDTIDVKFASSINEVCKTKGCWMKLDLGD